MKQEKNWLGGLSVRLSKRFSNLLASLIWAVVENFASHYCATFSLFKPNDRFKNS